MALSNKPMKEDFVINQEDAARLAQLGQIWIMQSGMNARELGEMAELAISVGTQLAEEADEKLRQDGEQLVQLGYSCSSQNVDVGAIDNLTRLAVETGEALVAKRNE